MSEARFIGRICDRYGVPLEAFYEGDDGSIYVYDHVLDYWSAYE